MEEYGQRGIRCMAVARTDADGQWHMLGLLTFLDPPRPDTKATLETALHYGVQTRMVSWAHGPPRPEQPITEAGERHTCYHVEDGHARWAIAARFWEKLRTESRLTCTHAC